MSRQIAGRVEVVNPPLRAKRLTIGNDPLAPSGRYRIGLLSDYV